MFGSVLLFFSYLSNKLYSESLLNIDISVKNCDDVLSAGIYSGINAKNSPENTSDTWINAIC